MFQTHHKIKFLNKIKIMEINTIKNQFNYSTFKNKDYLCIKPNEDKYDYSIFFFGGFRSHPNFYHERILNFFEEFSKSSKLKFKIIIPVLPKYQKDIFNYFRFFDKNTVVGKDIYSWFNYDFEDDICVGYTTNEDKDEYIKSLIIQELEKFNNNDEKLIFIGHSMGGRYLLHIIEQMQLKPKFNLLFKSYLFLYRNRRVNNYYSDEEKNNAKFKRFFENKFYLYFSKDDKIATLNMGHKSYDLLHDLFENIHLTLDESNSHDLDAHSFTFLKNTLISELSNNNYKF